MRAIFKLTVREVASRPAEVPPQLLAEESTWVRCPTWVELTRPPTPEDLDAIEACLERES